MILREIAAVRNIDFIFNVINNENENSVQGLDVACMDGYATPSESPLCGHVLSGDLPTAPSIGPKTQQ